MTPPERFRPVRSSRPPRAVDLRSNGPHRSAFRPVRSMPASARSSESILATHFEPDGQRRSEQFRRFDLKDESQPLISNLTTLCHPPGKPSGSPFRKPARSIPPSGALSEDDTCPQTRPINPSGTNLNPPRVPECRTREHFPGCRASAPRVPELKPRPYPADFPTTLRVHSERDTCPRVPPADKTLRKPPELATVPSD